MHLWNEELAKSRVNNSKILIALPITIRESKNIIQKVINVKDLKSIKKIDFWIKPHPAMDSKMIHNFFKSEWPENFKIIDIDTKVALREVNILISGMSSICLEGIAMGLPTIVVENEYELQYNPIPNELEQEIWKLCLTSSDISKSINYFMQRSNTKILEHEKISKKIKRRYFEPSTRNKIKEFLNLT